MHNKSQTQLLALKFILKALHSHTVGQTCKNRILLSLRTAQMRDISVISMQERSESHPLSLTFDKLSIAASKLKDIIKVSTNLFHVTSPPNAILNTTLELMLLVT